METKNKRLLSVVLCLGLAVVPGIWQTSEAKQKRAFTDTFFTDDCTFSDTGQNRYFVLQPGFQLVLEGIENKGIVNLTIEVLDDTEEVDGVLTRVVQETETRDGLLVEISRNFFAVCKQTNNVFYFGEEVDIYDQSGQNVISHEGSWRAGQNGARAGIIMPGTILLGARYFQELAPDVAMDRAEIMSMTEVVETPAGTFETCLKTRETTPLERRAREFKFYAPGIGIVMDGQLKLKRVTYPSP